MARTKASTPSKEILEAALQGLELQRQRLDEQISEVRSLLGRRPAGRPAKSSGEETESSSGQQQRNGRRRKRALSPEARKRIAAAQKKRWANFRKAQQ